MGRVALLFLVCSGWILVSDSVMRIAPDIVELFRIVLVTEVVDSKDSFRLGVTVLMTTVSLLSGLATTASVKSGFMVVVFVVVVVLTVSSTCLGEEVTSLVVRVTSPEDDVEENFLVTVDFVVAEAPLEVVLDTSSTSFAPASSARASSSFSSSLIPEIGTRYIVKYE